MNASYKVRPGSEHRTGGAETEGGGSMTEQLPEGTPPARQARVASSFAAFLPQEYQSGFSSDWLMGLSPFEDRTCAFCYSVKDGKWVAFGPKKTNEQSLICQRTG